MNKLAMEMRKRNIEYRKEICENLIRLYKNSLMFNWVVVVCFLVIAFWSIIIGVHYIMVSQWILTVLEFILATTDIWLAVICIGRIKVTKRNLEREKLALDYFNNELQSFENGFAS